jgi:hypothetical protein
MVVLAVLMIGNAGLFVYLEHRPDPADPFAGRPAPVVMSSQHPGRETTSPPAPASPTADAVNPVLAVYGDGYSAGSTFGGLGPAGWPSLVAQQIGAELRLNAVPKAGYASRGTSGQTFQDIARSSPVPHATITVVFGSRNDLGMGASTVRESARATYDAIRASAPSTTLVVVGPAWSEAAVVAELFTLRDAVRDAAEAAGAVFVDPLEDRWFDQPTGLIASDGVSPTDEGHSFLASRIAVALERGVSPASSSVSD